MTVMDAIKSALTASLTPSPAVFIIGLAVILLVPIILHFVITSATPYNTLPTVLLLGPSGAGKTALLTLYERGGVPKTATAPAVPVAPAQTHTSQLPASVELAVSEDGTSSFRDDLDASGAVAKKFLLLDTPGHGKLRNQHALSRLDFAKGSPNETANAKLKAVVYMVDAGALADGDELPAAAEYLYDVLLALQKRTGSGKSSKAPASVPVLVAANKLDLFTALPAALVKSNLEAELGRIRRTRSKGLLDSGVGTDEVGQGEESDDWLGEYGSEKFSFAQMREFDIEIDVIGGNIAGEGPGVDKWWTWIAQKI